MNQYKKEIIMSNTTEKTANVLFAIILLMGIFLLASQLVTA
jgi:hypothetical protein